MKLLRYYQDGVIKPGLLDKKGQIRALSEYVEDISDNNLLPEAIKTLRGLNVDKLPLVHGEPRLAACVGNIGKFICIGLNYADHAAETNAQIPSEPLIFSKYTSAICGPNDNIIIPKNSTKTDWEVELGVVIGKGGKRISQEDALNHVAGFCVINDLSEREAQLERQGQWVKGKSFDSFGPMGPYLVTPDEIEDYNNLHLWLEVDGKRYQDGNTKTMVYKVPKLINYLSQFFSLQPGDVISTGTPPGVGLGQKPTPIYLRAGQKVRLGIDGLGVQTQYTIDEE
ncbi:fumarylacetoacetate hydrolase family protein [Cysteiniphilum halobium]|uniref:fumarylacetoacetate hydrolase family protein n=1 Tax=Cysteiniphilum halobium TaxID=2219059 RepID=UPI000E65E419|nr:fumarylacetoacetate hydrolase family protein [Cysteiniphilum halobium]